MSVTERPSRRRLLAAAAGLLAGSGGCLAGGSEPDEDEREGGPEIVSVRHVTEAGVPYGEYVVVTVREPRATALLAGEIDDACEGTRRVTRRLRPGDRSYEFGPFGHHCLDGWKFQIVPRGETVDGRAEGTRARRWR